MRWDSVQTDAKNAGYLVYAMDQSQTDAMTMPGPWGNAYSGYCMGMAVRWIWLRTQGRDFAFNPGTQVYSATDWQATAIQNIYEDSTKKSEAEHWERAAAAYRMTVDEGLRLSRMNRPSGAFLNLLMTRSEGCFGISLNREGGGHAIAAQNEGGGVFRLFDANYGHFQAAGADEFKDFLDWYFQETGYDERYKKETFICGVNGPK